MHTGYVLYRAVVGGIYISKHTPYLFYPGCLQLREHLGYALPQCPESL